MTSNDLVRMDARQLEYISKVVSIPKEYRNNLPEIIACVQRGRELGIGDMQALQNIHIIEGTPSLSAEFQAALVRGHGHSIRVIERTNGQSVTIEGRRRDTGDSHRVTWDMERAKTAGLAVRPNWKNYSDAMLWARAVSQLCRELFSDVTKGLAYTPDELGSPVVEIPGAGFEVVDDADEDVVDPEPDEQAVIEVDDAVIDAALAEPDEQPPPAGEEGESLFQAPAPEVTERRKRNRETAD